MWEAALVVELPLAVDPLVIDGESGQQILVSQVAVLLAVGSVGRSNGADAALPLWYSQPKKPIN